MSRVLIEKIQTLKNERNAVILAHNYQMGDVQDVADFTGDSLGLSIRAASTDADVIVFCGVLFMAETAAILSPGKTVLLPDRNAGCPMADMITAGQLAKQKEKYPDAIVVCYVNSTAEVKAISDYCCTSSNAVELVKTLPQDRRILFVPDRHLGQFVIDRTGRDDIILWQGHCPSHIVIAPESIKNAKKKCPDAVVIAHPECSREAADCADELLSTGQMLTFVRDSSAKEFIVATETGIIHALQKENPDKEFIPATEKAICPNMKIITLEKLLWSLEDMQYIITVPEETAAKARKALTRMIEIVPAK